MNAIASRALVVVAHPCANSFCGGLAELVVTTLRARRVVDVVALWPFGAAGDFSADQPTAVAAADLLVLVYPTWWGGPPAPLKQWLDDELAGDNRAFRGIRRLVVVTTHGSPHWINRLQGEPGKVMVMRGLRSRCHPFARRTWLALYGLDGDDPVRRDRFKGRVQGVFLRL